MYINKAEDGFEEIVNISWSKDLRKLGYGISGIRIWFTLRKDNKAVQFLAYVKSFPKSVKTDNKVSDLFDGIEGWDLGYHSPHQMYDDDEKGECNILKDGCYYDGSSLNGREFYERLENKALNNKDFQMDKEIFNELRKYYRRTYCDSNEEFILTEKSYVEKEIDNKPVEIEKEIYILSGRLNCSNDFFLSFQKEVKFLFSNVVIEFEKTYTGRFNQSYAIKFKGSYSDLEGLRDFYNEYEI